jgi:hypothetical protein
MALNSSGPISLGGATTGQSINLELGQSALSVVALNDSNVRSLAGVSSGAITMPTDFWGKSSGPGYFWASITGTFVISNYPVFTQDSSGNYYFAVRFSDGATAKSSIVKVNSAFSSISAQIQYYSTTTSTSIAGMGIYGSTLAVCGQQRWNTVSPIRSGAIITRFDTNLNYLSNNLYYNSTTASWIFYGDRKVQSSGDWYLAYSNMSPCKYNIGTATLTSPPAMASAGIGGVNSVCSDTSNGNVYLAGKTNGDDSYTTYGATSSLTGIYCAYDNNLLDYGTGDSFNADFYSGFLYIAFANDGSNTDPGNYPCIAKINPADGNIISTKGVASNNSINAIRGLVCDGAGGIYIIQLNDVGFLNYTLAKFDTSLNLTWQRSFTFSAIMNVPKLFCDSSGALIIVGYNGNSTYILRYPTDGSKTGAYTVNGITITIGVDSKSTNTSGGGPDNFTLVGSTIPTSRTAVTQQTATDTRTLSKTTI